MDDLLQRARDAAKQAYVPYSEYPVGAALRTTEGVIYVGTNVENANYSNSLHAEEVALGAAVSEGHRSFQRLAVSSAARDGLTPCGMCRQTLIEFCDEAFPIVCDAGEETVEYSLGELIPDTISPEMLGKSPDG